MDSHEEHLFEHKVFILKPFKQLYTTLLLLGILCVLFSVFFNIFFSPITQLFGLYVSSSFNYTFIILLFLGYGFFQQVMLRKVIEVPVFHNKVKAYFKFFRIRLLLVFTVLVVSCIQFALSQNAGQFFWILINTVLLILLKPNVKLIPQELKEVDINFV